MIYINKDRQPTKRGGTQQMAICQVHTELVDALKAIKLVGPNRYISRDGKLYKAVISTTLANKLLKEDDTMAVEPRDFIKAIRKFQG